MEFSYNFFLSCSPGRCPGIRTKEGTVCQSHKSSTHLTLHFCNTDGLNARLANSLPKIEIDFEKEIARIMARPAPRRTEKIVGYQLIQAAITRARFRAVASRIRLRKRNDFGVASTYSSMSMYSIARSKLIHSGASS